MLVGLVDRRVSYDGGPGPVGLGRSNDITQHVWAGCNRNCVKNRNFRTHTEERPPQAARRHKRPSVELTYHIYHSHSRGSRHLDRPPLIYMTLTVVGERQPRNTWARTPFERRVGRVILSLWRTPTSCGSAPKPSDRWYKAPSRRRSCRSRPTAERTDFFRIRPLFDAVAVTTSLA